MLVTAKSFNGVTKPPDEIVNIFLSMYLSLFVCFQELKNVFKKFRPYPDII